MIVNFLIAVSKPGRLLDCPFDRTDPIYDSIVFDEAIDNSSIETFLHKNVQPTSSANGIILLVNPKAPCIRMYMNNAERVYMRLYETSAGTEQVSPDERFWFRDFDAFDIKSYSIEKFDLIRNLKYRDITYARRHLKTHHGEIGYLNELTMIMEHGEKDRPDRTGVGTISTFGHQLRFDISHSIPLLTTKFVPWKAVIKELLWFLRGETDSKTLEKDGVNIWRLNSTREFLDKNGLNDYREGTIGPMYGWIWNHVGATYSGPDTDYGNSGINQLENLITGLKEDPYSRRHLLTTYSPEHAKSGVLYPCHGVITQFYVHAPTNGGLMQLSCHTYCRSQDTFLGQPFNIASYAILTYIIAKMCNMTPKELVLSTGDTHIYKSHVAQVQQQLTRTPWPFPILEVNDDIQHKSFKEITIDDFKLIGYIHHPPIKADMAV